MGLLMPNHIDSAKIQGLPVNYSWSDIGSDSVYVHESPNLIKSIFILPFRAQLALSVGIAEWIAWRFDGMSDYRATIQFIEALWAGIINFHYTIPWDLRNEPSPSGQIVGPLYHTNKQLSKIFNLCKIKSNGGAKHTVYLSFLSRYVMPSKSPFEKWLKAILSRLAMLYPFDKSNRMGIPIPRESLDLKFNFKLEMTNDLCSRYLTNLEYKNNPYLRVPEEMIDLGFEGTPYTL